VRGLIGILKATPSAYVVYKDGAVVSIPFDYIPQQLLKIASPLSCTSVYDFEIAKLCSAA